MMKERTRAVIDLKTESDSIRSITFCHLPNLSGPESMCYLDLAVLLTRAFRFYQVAALQLKKPPRCISRDKKLREPLHSVLVQSV